MEETMVGDTLEIEDLIPYEDLGREAGFTLPVFLTDDLALSFEEELGLNHAGLSDEGIVERTDGVVLALLRQVRETMCAASISEDAMGVMEVRASADFGKGRRFANLRLSRVETPEPHLLLAFAPQGGGTAPVEGVAGTR